MKNSLSFRKTAVRSEEEKKEETLDEGLSANLKAIYSIKVIVMQQDKATATSGRPRHFMLTSED